MGLTDDPLYKKMIEGYDTKLIVGTITLLVSGPSGPRSITFPLFLVDYHNASGDMEKIVKDAIDVAKKINLRIKDGTYTVDVPEQATVVMVSEGETAAHTAPTFWAEYTPTREEHEAFQREYARMGAWMFTIITKDNLREILIGPTGEILLRKARPLTDDLRKMFGVE